MGVEAGQRGGFSTRDLVYIAILAAAWAIVETSVGNYLHAARVPFTGGILTAVGMALALAGRAIVARRCTVLMIGAVTAILRLLGIGGLVLWPLLGILMESLLAELALLPFGRPGRGAYMLAGALATFWTVVHPFVTQGLLGGTRLLTVYQWALQGAAQLIPFSRGVAWSLALTAVAVPVALGVVAGLLGYDLGRALRARLAA